MAQITPQKSSLVAQIADLVGRSKSVAIVNYRGLKVGQISELRQLIRQAGGQLLVTKNTLFKIGANRPEMDLTGTSAFIFSFADEVSAVKVVADFAKKHNLPEFKAGLLGSRVLSTAEITALSTIPDKATLVAKLLSSLNSPLYRLANSLNWNISQLVRTLDAVRMSKSV